MRHSDLTLALAVPAALMAIGAAAWLLHAQVRALDGAGVAPAGSADSYRPGPGWMHREPPGFIAVAPAAMGQVHALTSAAGSPTLARWTPLP